MVTPPGVRAYTRCGDQAELLFLINETEQAQIIQLPEAWQDALSGAICQSVTLAGVDVCVLKRPVASNPAI